MFSQLPIEQLRMLRQLLAELVTIQCSASLVPGHTWALLKGCEPPSTGSGCTGPSACSAASSASMRWWQYSDSAVHTLQKHDPVLMHDRWCVNGG